MNVAMNDLEHYINAESDLDVLIRAALIHYQFETIHPFLDGNGRVGRLLITLYLMVNKVLTRPALYISCFLKQNRIEYYDRLTEVRLKGNYEQWIGFFLKAVDVSAQDAIAAIDEMSALQDKHYKRIAAMGRASRNTRLVFEYLASNPIIDIGKTADALGLAYNTVSAAVGRLIDADILVQTERADRHRSFAYRDYLDILRRGT